MLERSDVSRVTLDHRERETNGFVVRASIREQLGKGQLRGDPRRARREIAEQRLGTRDRACASRGAQQSLERSDVIRIHGQRPREVLERRLIAGRVHEHPPTIPPGLGGCRVQGVRHIRGTRDRAGQFTEHGRIVVGVAREDRPRPRELEGCPIICLHRRIGYPSGQSGAVGDEQREDAERVVRTHASEIVGDTGTSPMVGDPAQSWCERFGRSNEKHVAVADQPERAVREDGEKRGDDRHEVAGADVIGVCPLAQQTAGREPRAGLVRGSASAR